MLKLPSFNDLFVTVMACFIAFGLMLGVTQATLNVNDFSGMPVLAQTSSTTDNGTPATPAGVTSCPVGQILKFSPNYIPGTGYCVKAEPIPTLSANGDNKNEVRASSTVSKKYIDAQCIVKAVTDRDTALVNGLGAYNEIVITALTNRIASLTAAWQLPDRIGRKVAIRQAWNAFRKAVQSATKDLNKVKKDVWAKYYVDRKACGIYATSDDTTSRSVDVAL